MFPRWYPYAPQLALRDQVRSLQPEYSLLENWHDRATEWADHFRPALVELLGLPQEKPELSIRELDAVRCEGYSRLRVVYNVEEGMSAPAWVLVPRDNQEPLPAVICCHRRGATKDEPVGLTGDLTEDSHLAFADELARRGYVVLVPDARCCGERACDEQGLSAVATLLGRPLLGMQVWDLMRGVDYLEQRPDVKSSRIGVTGWRMGARHALFLAAIDERLNCAAATGGLSTLQEAIIAHDCFSGIPPPDELLPGLLRLGDLQDVACLAAPRALMLVQGKREPHVPQRGAVELLARVEAGFEALGEEIKAETHLIDDHTRFPADLIFRFLDDWLKLPEPERAH